MRKQTTKPQSNQQKTHSPRILTASELQQVTGGDNVMKLVTTP